MRERSPATAALGRAVRRARRRLGVSQEELGFRAGLHRTYVGAIERGEKSLGFGNLLVLARALEVPAAELVAEAERELEAGAPEG